MADTRTSHPYYMYDHIQAQPDAWSNVVSRTREATLQLAELMKDTRQVFIVGTGTSFHAAQTGENILRKYGNAPSRTTDRTGNLRDDALVGDIEYRAITAFDFALYTPHLAPDDAVIVLSHRGTKNYSVQSLILAKGAGCRTILVTGEGTHAVPTPGQTDYVFVTVPQEQSSAHTFSYIGSVAVLSNLAYALGRVKMSEELLSDELLTSTIPRAIKTALESEDEVAKLAQEYADRRRIWIVGGGPAAIVATETALKIKETSHLQAEGLMTETMIHGPFQCVESEDVFILIAPAGAARARTMEIAGMIQEIGAPYIVVSDGREGEVERGAGAWVLVPKVPEPFSPLTCLMPMQLFTYHLALAKGRNPDIFRRDDPRFARASARITL